jgi:hypothetical protein
MSDPNLYHISYYSCIGSFQHASTSHAPHTKTCTLVVLVQLWLHWMHSNESEFSTLLVPLYHPRQTSWVVCCFVELPAAVPVIYCSTRLEKDSLLLEARKSSSRFYPSSSYYYSSSRYRFSAIVLQHPRHSWSKQDSARPCIVTGAISFLQIINKYVFKLRQCSGMCRFST